MRGWLALWILTGVTFDAACLFECDLRDAIATDPGALRAFFRKYHIGGCARSSFQPSESGATRGRNGNPSVAKVSVHGVMTIADRFDVPLGAGKMTSSHPRTGSHLAIVQIRIPLISPRR